MTVLSHRSSYRLAIVMLLVVAVLGASLWSLQPERGAVWGLTIVLLPLMWGAVALLRRAVSCTATPADDGLVHRSIALAGLILALSLSAKLASSLHWVDDGSGHGSDRFMGVVLGIVFVVTSNAIPKRLTPLSRTECEPSRAQAVQRFVGWSFVLAGLGYALCWLLLPFDSAKLASTTVLASGVALAILRVAAAYARPRTTPPANQPPR